MRNAYRIVSATALLAWACGDIGEVPNSSAPFGNDPTRLALAAIVDYEANVPVSDAEMGVDADGLPVVRTRIEIALTPEATVGAVEALLAEIDGQVDSTLAGVLLIRVRIPDPGTTEALEALARRVQALDIVRYVNLAWLPQPALLPANYDEERARADGDRLAHLLAVRAPAAWNGQAAMARDAARTPLLVEVDFFGGGPPDTAFDVEVPAADLVSGSTGDGHGYSVLSVVAGRLGGDDDARGLATGMYPGTTSLRAIDLTSNTNVFGWQNSAIRLIRAASGNVVLNTSIGLGPCARAGCRKRAAEQGALAWIERVRGSASFLGLGGGDSLEGRFLHVTAAGNVAPGEADTEAGWTSEFTAAALVPLADGDGTPVANLTNILVVENRTANSQTGYAPGCLSPTSSVGGMLSAIGTAVYALTSAVPSATGPPSADYVNGTSFASPAVAGLAAYVWALDAGRTPQDIARNLIETARSVEGGECAPGAPVIDAYAAVLGVDEPGFTRVRDAILDVAGSAGSQGGDGRFSEADLRAFLERFEVASGRLDYSRYDLNGDGRTGGGQADRFNLDIETPPTLDVVSEDIEDRPVEFDEAAVTDLEVLCWYAYGPLYNGSEAERDDLLGTRRCSQALVVDLAPPGVCPGRTVPIVVWVRRSDPETGALEPAADLWLELWADGGRLEGTSGTTDQSGAFHAAITVDADRVTLGVNVFERQGGRLLTSAENTSDAPPDCQPETDPCRQEGATFAAAYQEHIQSADVDRTLRYEVSGAWTCDAGPALPGCGWWATQTFTNSNDPASDTQGEGPLGGASAPLAIRRNATHCTTDGVIHQPDGSTYRETEGTIEVEHSYIGCSVYGVSVGVGEICCFDEAEAAWYVCRE